MSDEENSPRGARRGKRARSSGAASLLAPSEASGDYDTFQFSQTDNASRPFHAGDDCELRKPKTIHDRLYGSITVMDTPEFERLDRVSQLGGSSVVYPSAHHTRKEHSLGVAYIAGQVVTHLKRLQPELCLDESDRLCVMLAGLGHDLGHGPYSHMWEQFIKQATGRKEGHEDMSLQLLRRIGNKLRRAGAPRITAAFCREETRLFRPLAAYLDCSEEEAETHLNFACKLIEGLRDDEAMPDDIGRSETKRFLFDIVANSRSGIDVDKLDYLPRDSLSAFGGTALHKWKRIIDASRVVKYDGTYQIAFEDKMVPDINDVFGERAKMHRVVYQHRVANVNDQMKLDMFLMADASDLRFRNPAGGAPLRLSEAARDPEAFLELSDSIVDVIRCSTAAGLEGAHALLGRIQRRDYYRQVDRSLSLPTLPLCRACYAETEISDRFCRSCGASTRDRATPCEDGCRRCGETDGCAARVVSTDGVLRPAWTKYTEAQAKAAILRECEGVDSDLVEVTITHITHGQAWKVADPHSTNSSKWLTYDPIANVTFYNPKLGPEKQARRLSSKQIPGLFMPKNCMERTLFLYFKGDAAAQPRDFAAVERGFKAYAQRTRLKQERTTSNVAPSPSLRPPPAPRPPRADLGACQLDFHDVAAAPAKRIVHGLTQTQL